MKFSCLFYEKPFNQKTNYTTDFPSSSNWRYKNCHPSFPQPSNRASTKFALCRTAKTTQIFLRFMREIARIICFCYFFWITQHSARKLTAPYLLYVHCFSILENIWTFNSCKIIFTLFSTLFWWLYIYNK